MYALCEDLKLVNSLTDHRPAAVLSELPIYFSFPRRRPSPRHGPAWLLYAVYPERQRRAVGGQVRTPALTSPVSNAVAMRLSLIVGGNYVNATLISADKPVGIVTARETHRMIVIPERSRKLNTKISILLIH